MWQDLAVFFPSSVTPLSTMLFFFFTGKLTNHPSTITFLIRALSGPIDNSFFHFRGKQET